MSFMLTVRILAICNSHLSPCFHSFIFQSLFFNLLETLFVKKMLLLKSNILILCYIRILILLEDRVVKDLLFLHIKIWIVHTLKDNLC